MIAFMEWVGEWLRTWMPYSDQVTVGYVLRAFAQAAIAFMTWDRCRETAKEDSFAYCVVLMASVIALFSSVGLYDELMGVTLFLLFGQRGGM
jgi:hypothetical protein